MNLLTGAYHGFAILGMLMASAIVVWFFVNIFFVFRHAIQDTQAHPVDYKTPLRFVRNVWKHAVQALKSD